MGSRRPREELGFYATGTPVIISADMADIQERVEELARLMLEYQLSEAELEGDGWKVGFRRRTDISSHVAPLAGPVELGQAPVPSHLPSAIRSFVAEVGERANVEPPTGEPLESPMNGIYYASPSPSAPYFVKEGEEVEEGQVLALIEAMKVFNEIVAPGPARVTKIIAQNSQLVQPGDVLMYLEPVS